MLEPVEEEILLLRCAGGDKTALSELEQKYGQPLYDFLCKISGGSSSRSQSLLLQAFAEGFRLYRPGKAKHSFLALVLRALVKKAAHESAPENQPPSKNLDLKAHWILAALRRLSYRQRVLILLRTQMDFLYEEIAFVLSASTPAVKSQLKDARLLFREKIDEVMKANFDELQSNSRTNE